MSSSKLKRVGVTPCNAVSLIPIGTPIGLCDSEGKEFKTGDIVRCGTDNEDVHGKWVEYEILLQGTTPLVVYLRSESGNVFRRGGTAGFLSDFYNTKSFVFAERSLDLRPEDHIVIVVPELDE
tara:strand:+ start:368 stop:736 length:369 start_codon:yes stop_codon:yes gene_type:complete